MSLVQFDLDRDVAEAEAQTQTAFTIDALTAAQVRNISAFVAESTSTGFLNNAQGSATTIPLSSTFRHISHYFFSSTAVTTIPIAHDNTSTTSIVRAIQVGRTTMDDTLVSGSLTATLSFGTTANNTYIDVPEDSITSSVGRKGSLVSQGNTSNVVGTVFYDTGTLLFHGGTGWPHFLVESASSMQFGSTSAGQIVITSFSFKALNIKKKATFFCRAFNKEMNYTNNVTSLENQVTGTITGSLTANPRTYITTVGLYNEDSELLAVAKSSPPIKKTFGDEIIIGVNLQY